MSKKKILSEEQVRRFMGLAGLPVVNEMGGMHYGQREDDELDVAAEEEPELPGDEGPEDMGMELPDEGGDDLDLSPEQKEDLAADIVRAPVKHQPIGV